MGPSMTADEAPRNTGTAGPALADDPTPSDDFRAEVIRQDPDLDADGLFLADVGAMTLVSGLRVNPLTMRPSDVDIIDIAHALARQCRYNGHCGGYLSVARHSLWVSGRVVEMGQPDLALTALLHDAAEAYLGDMIRPLKRGEIGTAYREAEHRVESAVAAHFGLDYPMPSPVLEADNYVLLNVELSGEEARWNWWSSIEEDQADFLAEFVRLREVARG